MRALIFDFDGLIVDTEYPEFEAWAKVYSDHGLELKAEQWVHVVGTADLVDFRVEFERLSGRKLDWEPIDLARTRHHQRLMAAQKVLPGVEMLMSAGRKRGWRVGVASNSSAKWVEDGLARYGLMRWVETVRSRDRVAKTKPHPEPYLLALADLEARAELSIAFEDSATGVRSAKAAGLRAVAVPNRLTRLHDLSQADLVLESLEHFELPS